jgi:hypothetical protein
VVEQTGSRTAASSGQTQPEEENQPMTTQQIEFLDQIISEMETDLRLEKQRERANEFSKSKINNDSQESLNMFAEYPSDLKD